MKRSRGRGPGTRRAPPGGVQVLEGRVRDLTLAGDAVVDTPAGIVMVRGALLDEQVQVRAEQTRRGVRWGTLLKVLDASPHRVEPRCPLHSRCGGCPLMTLAHAAQLEHKRSLVARAVADSAHAGLQVGIEPAPEPWGYRRRARLGFDARGAQRKLGYRVAGSRELLDVPQCVVLEPALQHALDALRGTLLPALHGLGEIALALGGEGRAVAHVMAEDAQPAATYRAAEALLDVLGGVQLSVQGGAPARFGATAQAHAAAGELGLSAPPDGFAQAHGAVNARLIAHVVELCAPAGAKVLELYAGHGNLSLPLARQAAELHAVEADVNAAQALRDNAARHGLRNLRVTAGAAEAHVGQGAVDAVVLDPPRAGARATLDAVVARKPTRIVYVSCQPPTLRRDVQALSAAGYVVDTAVALDMFPHTGHVEAVVRLVPR